MEEESPTQTHWRQGGEPGGQLSPVRTPTPYSRRLHSGLCMTCVLVKSTDRVAGPGLDGAPTNQQPEHFQEILTLSKPQFPDW